MILTLPAVPGPDRYHQDWLVIDVTEEVAQVAPEIKARNSDDEDGSMFSNHSEEKCSYRSRFALIFFNFILKLAKNVVFFQR